MNAPALVALGAPDADTPMSPPLGWPDLFAPRKLADDSGLALYVTAQALAARSRRILDIGCGRGALVDVHQPGGAVQDLRGRGRRVLGIDVDPAGADNPVVDAFGLITPDGRWPVGDEDVDLAVSDFVLEHVADPGAFVDELSRALRPGGVFLARTVQRWSLLAVGARLTPNRAHARALGHLQPGRRERDVFPTIYRMNTRHDLAALLDDGFEWSATARPGLEHYLRPWPGTARLAAAAERHLPAGAQTALVVCARRRGAD